MWECKNTWTRLGTCHQDLTLFPYIKSLEAEIHMLIPLPLLQPPLRKVYLRSSWSRICATLPRWRGRQSRFINWGWDLVGWILLSYILRMKSCPRRRGRLTKCEERLRDFGCLRTKCCTSTFFWAIFAMHPSWSSRATSKRVTRRDLWKLYRRQILVSQGPYARILVAQYAKGNSRICEEVWPVSEICSQHSSARGCS